MDKTVIFYDIAGTVLIKDLIKVDKSKIKFG